MMDALDARSDLSRPSSSGVHILLVLSGTRHGFADCCEPLV